MADTFEGKIAKTLMMRVATIAGGIPTAYPDRPFEPPQSLSGDVLDYLEVSHLPNGYALETTAYADTAQGILQIALMKPEGTGSVKPQDGAGAIVAHFSKGLRLFGLGVNVTIQGRPTVGQSFPDNGYTRTPVTIQYHASEVS